MKRKLLTETGRALLEKREHIFSKETEPQKEFRQLLEADFELPEEGRDLISVLQSQGLY